MTPKHLNNLFSRAVEQAKQANQVGLYDETRVDQCCFEDVVKHSDEPERLRCTLLLELILYQAFRKALPSDDFLRFGYPRVTSHGVSCDVRPEWVLHESRKRGGQFASVNIEAVASVMLDEVFSLVESKYGRAGVEKLKAELFYQRKYTRLNSILPDRVKNPAGTAFEQLVYAR